MLNHNKQSTLDRIFYLIIAASGFFAGYNYVKYHVKKDNYIKCLEKINHSGNISEYKYDRAVDYCQEIHL